VKRWPVIPILLALLLSACGTTSVFELKKGDCFNEPSEDVVSDVPSVPCAEPHDYEIFGVVDHPAGSGEAYPGTADIEAVVNTECAALFEPFVGTPYTDSALFIYYLAPGEDSWADGDREILCALFKSEEKLEGSMQGSEL
jgi:hypothetical protein